MRLSTLGTVGQTKKNEGRKENRGSTRGHAGLLLEDSGKLYLEAKRNMERRTNIPTTKSRRWKLEWKFHNDLKKAGTGEASGKTWEDPSGTLEKVVADSGIRAQSIECYCRAGKRG